VRECPPDFRFDFYDLAKVAGATSFLAKKAAKPDAISWFRRFYLELYGVAKEYYQRYQRYTYYAENYLGSKTFTLTSDKRLTNRYDAYLPPEKSISDLLVKYKIPLPKDLVHPDLFEDQSTVDSLRDFFKTYLGVRTVDARWVAGELVRRLCSPTPPSEEECLDLTRALFTLWKKDQQIGLCDGKMWVLTKAWLKLASEVWFSNDYEPR
jgi:hypothetical protein